MEEDFTTDVDKLLLVDTTDDSIDAVRTRVMSNPELSLDDRIKLIPSQLTKLEIVTYFDEQSLIVSMRQLQNIKTLRLQGCILEITDGAVCAPVELHIYIHIYIYVYFSRNRIDFEMNVVKLNDLFDFRNLKDILVDSKACKTFELDLSEGALKLNNLVYVNFKAPKWESSKWTVRKLTLNTDKGRTSPTGMVFEELKFHGSVLDVETLPTTLRSFEINRVDVELLHIEAVQNLVNLKYLLLHRCSIWYLPAFQNCANLTHLHLNPTQWDTGVKLIPKTVKVFRLTHNCVPLGKTDSEIETVILEGIPFEDAYLYLKENFSENLKNVLIYDPMIEMKIDEVMKELSLQRYIVGPFFRTAIST
ncbi:hypothetical protein Bhyg_11348, partial [Pseudolycoriella hygida]